MTAPVASLTFVRAYVVTMRPYLLFVSGITGVAGMAFAAAAPAWITVLLAAACFGAYGFGQALTDCSQLDTDALSAPYRPLVRGTIRRGDVLAVSLSGLAVTGALLTWFAPRNLPLALLAVLGLATYTPFKRRWWAGPFYNAWIVALLAIIAWLATAGAAGAPASWSVAFGATLVAVFCGYANFVLTGYYKDTSADRATGYRTLPVVLGFGPAALVSDGFAACQIAAAVVAAGALLGDGPTLAHAPGLALLAAGAGAALFAQWRLHGVRDEGEAHTAIAPVVHAYLLVLGGIAALARPSWAPGLALFYAAFVWVLSRRPLRRQI